MATCKDCLHFFICRKERNREFWEEQGAEYGCKDFKDKTRFVEVVPCEKCIYKDDCARQMTHTTRDYVLEQNISTYNKVDFCSYGERKMVGEGK